MTHIMYKIFHNMHLFQDKSRFYFICTGTETKHRGVFHLGGIKDQPVLKGKLSEQFVPVSGGLHQMPLAVTDPVLLVVEKPATEPAVKHG